MLTILYTVLNESYWNNTRDHIYIYIYIYVEENRILEKWNELGIDVRGFE